MSQNLLRLAGLVLAGLWLQGGYEMRAQSNYERLTNQVVTIYSPQTAKTYRIIQDCNLYSGWESLPQCKFWCEVMNLHMDTTVVNVARNRQVLCYVPTPKLSKLSYQQKEMLKDSLRRAHSLPAGEDIYLTFGKNHFYKFRETLQDIDQSIDLFANEGVDPWFAQAILLIESPGRPQRSIAGAQGSFQLMSSVARQMGLRVDKYVDERVEFEKSARAAAKLIRTVCIPATQNILRTHGLSWNEHDIWYRLLVMHVYHAGHANVRRVVDHIKPSEGGMPLIRTIWRTEYGSFGNASQNYSQLALAAMMELDRIVQAEFNVVCDCCTK